MKKIFSKFEKNEKIETANKESNNYVGKGFVVGRVSVTVEDILAEGKILYKIINMCITNVLLLFKDTIMFYYDFKSYKDNRNLVKKTYISNKVLIEETQNVYGNFFIL